VFSDDNDKKIIINMKNWFDNIAEFKYTIDFKTTGDVLFIRSFFN
jgi:hypothetical protein